MHTINILDEFLTVRQCAHIAGVPELVIRQFIQAGTLPATRITPRRTRVRREALVSLLGGGSLAA